MDTTVTSQYDADRITRLLSQYHIEDIKEVRQKEVDPRQTDDVCCICLLGLKQRSTNVFCSVKCGTIFHKSCIWHYNNTRCPICRTCTIYRSVL